MLPSTLSHLCWSTVNGHPRNSSPDLLELLVARSGCSKKGPSALKLLSYPAFLGLRVNSSLSVSVFTFTVSFY